MCMVFVYHPVHFLQVSAVLRLAMKNNLGSSNLCILLPALLSLPERYRSVA